MNVLVVIQNYLKLSVDILEVIPGGPPTLV